MCAHASGEYTVGSRICALSATALNSENTRAPCTGDGRLPPAVSAPTSLQGKLCKADGCTARVTLAWHARCMGVWRAGGCGSVGECMNALERGQMVCCTFQKNPRRSCTAATPAWQCPGSEDWSVCRKMCCL